MDENRKGQLKKETICLLATGLHLHSSWTYFEDFFVDLMNSCMDLCRGVNFRIVQRGQWNENIFPGDGVQPFSKTRQRGLTVWLCGTDPHALNQVPSVILLAVHRKDEYGTTILPEKNELHFDVRVTWPISAKFSHRLLKRGVKAAGEGITVTTKLARCSPAHLQVTRHSPAPQVGHHPGWATTSSHAMWSLQPLIHWSGESRSCPGHLHTWKRGCACRSQPARIVLQFF